MQIRHQPPVRSPASLRQITVAALAAAAPGQVEERAARILSERYAAREAILCGSGTQALQLAIEHARRHLGGSTHVAAPGYTCYDVATALIATSSQVHLYDIDPLSLAPDIDSIERALMHGARILIVAPLYGFTADYSAVLSLARRYGAVVIEDIAQGHGASWQGHRLGTLADLATVSFGRGKGWTGGGGGALIVGYHTQIAPLRLAGASPRAEVMTFVGAAAATVLGRPLLYGLPRAFPFLRLGETVYHPPRPASRITRTSAALLVRTAEVSDLEAKRRATNAGYYDERLRSSSTVSTPRPVPGSEPGYLRYPVLVSAQVRDAAADRQAVALGIAGGYPLPLAGLSELSGFLVGGQDRCPGSAELASRLLTLPVHGLLARSDLDRAVNWIERTSSAAAEGRTRLASQNA